MMIIPFINFVKSNLYNRPSVTINISNYSRNIFFSRLLKFLAENLNTLASLIMLLKIDLPMQKCNVFFRYEGWNKNQLSI